MTTLAQLDTGQWVLLIGSFFAGIASIIASLGVLLKMYYDAREARESRAQQAAAIRQNTVIVATVQKQTNRGLGVALRGKATADRALAVAMGNDPVLSAVAAISERAADEHDAQAKVADEDTSRRADKAVGPVEAAKPSDPHAGAALTRTAKATEAIAETVTDIKDTLAASPPARPGDVK